MSYRGLILTCLALGLSPGGVRFAAPLSDREPRPANVQSSSLGEGEWRTPSQRRKHHVSIGARWISRQVKATHCGHFGNHEVARMRSFILPGLIAPILASAVSARPATAQSAPPQGVIHQLLDVLQLARLSPVRTVCSAATTAAETMTVSPVSDACGKRTAYPRRQSSVSSDGSGALRQSLRMARHPFDAALKLAIHLFQAGTEVNRQERAHRPFVLDAWKTPPKKS